MKSAAGPAWEASELAGVAWEVSELAGVGRVLRAARDLPACTVVLRDSPLARLPGRGPRLALTLESNHNRQQG